MGTQRERGLGRQVIRENGFTLIEILIVVAIIGILAALVIPNLGSLSDKARIEKTKVMIEAISNALEAYHAEFREYPPDGFDVLDGANAQGVEVDAIDPVSRTPNPTLGKQRRRNSACLIYFLMLRHQKVSRLGADGSSTTSALSRRTKLVGPFLPEGSLGAEHFSLYNADGKPDFVNPLCEIVDGFGFPLEYDNVKTVGRLTPRDGNPSGFHAAASFELARARVLEGTDLCPSGAHSLVETFNDSRDPRRAVDEDDGCVILSGNIRSSNVGAFDVWAHSIGWSNPRDDIGNFTGK